MELKRRNLWYNRKNVYKKEENESLIRDFEKLTSQINMRFNTETR